MTRLLPQLLLLYGTSALSFQRYRVLLVQGRSTCMSTHPSSFLPPPGKREQWSDVAALASRLDMLNSYCNARPDTSLDALESSYAQQWLTRLLGCCHDEGILERASILLSRLSQPGGGGCGSPCSSLDRPSTVRGASFFAIALTRSWFMSPSVEHPSAPKAYTFARSDGGETIIAVQDHHMGNDVNATGFRTWDSAIYLARQVISTPAHFFPQSVPQGLVDGALVDDSTQLFRMLELGSGTGLAGIALLKAHQTLVDDNVSTRPAHLTFTDYDDQTLATLRETVIANLPVPSECQPSSSNWAIAKLAWEQPEMAVQYELIIGCDVVYEHHHPGLIHSVASKLLMKSDTSALHIVLSLRPTHTDDIEEFERLFGGSDSQAQERIASQPPRLQIVQTSDSRDFQYPLRHYKIQWRV